MGRLTITVESCDLFLPCFEGRVHPRVSLLVDERFSFHTKAHYDHSPEFKETFHVGAIHNKAVINVTVAHASNRMRLISGLLSSSSVRGQSDNRGRECSAEEPAARFTPSSVTPNAVLGRCQVSIRRLANGVPRTRTYYLSTLPSAEVQIGYKRWVNPKGITGTITLTLRMDHAAYSPAIVQFDNGAEDAFHRRLARLFLRYDPSRIGSIDLLSANCREPSELLTGTSWAEVEQLAYTNHDSKKKKDSGTKTKGGDAAAHTTQGGWQASWVELNSLVAAVRFETFSELLERLLREEGWSEPKMHSVTVRVKGCSAINVIGFPASRKFETVFVVLRTPIQSSVSARQAIKKDLVVWDWEVEMDVVDPATWHLQVVLMGRVESGESYELGRAVMSVGALSLYHTSQRNIFLMSFDRPPAPILRGIAHFTLLPHCFGDANAQEAMKVDELYSRLSRFFCRYAISRLPEVDGIIQSRRNTMDKMMKTLSMEYGNEPLTCQLFVTIEKLRALKEDVHSELHNKNVVVRLLLGESCILSFSRRVHRYADTMIEETYVFDVARDSDVLLIEVVNAADGKVYGSTMVSVRNLQRHVDNTRRDTLVGNAGEPDAYLSGVVYLSLRSPTIGHDYVTDREAAEMYYGRLQRYMIRRLPEEVHRVGMLVSTVFDMETFMSNLSAKYGEEDPTYVISFTVLGTQSFSFRLGGGRQVVVRSGMASKNFKVKKGSDGNKFSEFFFDRLEDHEIRLVLVDHVDATRPKANAWTSIRLRDVEVEKEYFDSVLLADRHGRAVGTVGVKYVVKNLSIVDTTRAKIVRSRVNPLTREVRAVAERVQDNPTSGEAQAGRFSRLRRMLSRKGGKDGAVLPTGEMPGSMVSRQQSEVTSVDGIGCVGGGMSAMGDTCHHRIGNLMDQLVLDFNDFEPSSHMSSRAPSVGSPDEDECVQGLSDTGLLNSVVKPRRGLHHLHDSADILHVKLFYCTDLHGSERQLPFPYVILSTIEETFHSSTKRQTLSPRYDENFVFHLAHPDEIALHVSVMTDTALGVQKLGHCVLSFKNVQRKQSLTRRVALVVNDSTKRAYEEGYICLALMGENFGLDYPPEVEDEEHLRRSVREYMNTDARDHLHRLEWFTGQFVGRETQLLSAFQGKQISVSKATVTVEVKISEVTDLFSDGWKAYGKCRVRIRGDSKHFTKTKWAYNTVEKATFVFNETMKVNVPDSRSAMLTVEVDFDQETKVVGECFIPCCLARLQPDTPWRHMLVVHAQTPAAIPSGYITMTVGVPTTDPNRKDPTAITNSSSLALLHDDLHAPTPLHKRRRRRSDSQPLDTGDSSAEFSPVDHHRDYQRLLRYYRYYKRNDLAMAAVRFVALNSVSSHLESLRTTYGAEPEQHNVRVTIQCCMNMQVENEKPRELMVLVHCGLQEYTTSKVSGMSDFPFNESFDVEVCLPQYDVITLIVAQKKKKHYEEVGRSRVLLTRIPRGVNHQIRHPLAFKGEQTSLVGTIVAELYTTSFGEDPNDNSDVLSEFGEDQRNSQNTSFPAIQDGSALFYRSNTMLDTIFPGRRSNLSSGPPTVNGDGGPSLASTSGTEFSYASIEGNSVFRSYHPDDIEGGFISPMDNAAETRAVITIESLKGLSEYPEELRCKVRDEQKNVLLRTKPIRMEHFRLIRESFYVDDAASLSRVSFTLQIKAAAGFGSSALVLCNFCLRRCTPGCVTQRRLRLFDLTTHHFVGLCVLKVQLPPMGPEETAAFSPLAANQLAALEEMEDEIITIGSIYAPQVLKQLDTTLYRSVSMHRVNDRIRDQLIPSAIGTAFVGVCDLRLEAQNIPLFKGKEDMAKKVKNLYISAELAKKGSVKPSVIYTADTPMYGMAKMQQLPYYLLRVDFLESDGGNMDHAVILRVGLCRHRHSILKGKEIGKATISLRALLTTSVYSPQEKVSIPLVSMTDGAQINAVYVGEITIMGMPALFCRFSPQLYIHLKPRGTVFDQRYAEFSFARIRRFAEHYDPSLMFELHYFLYEQILQDNEHWKKSVQDYVREKVMSWGPEVGIEDLEEQFATEA